MSDFHIAEGFPDGIKPIPSDHAAKRVISFCCNPSSGWRTYDLAGAEARAAGHFDTVAPWSLLWADALAGRVSVDDLGEFSFARRQELAKRISAIPRNADLAVLDEAGRKAVHDVCKFGYPGVWAPKSTKVSSLYRPHAVPVLDGYVALAFGFKREGFSQGAVRLGRIERVIDSMAAYLGQHQQQMRELRYEVGRYVSDIDKATDLRLLDMVIWCSQDDRLQRAGKKSNAWLNAPERPYEPDAVTPIPVTAG